MALLFELVVECGPQQADAEALGRHFRGLAWTLTDATEVLIEGYGLHQDAEGNWWTWIGPSGVSRRGVGTPEDAQQLTEVGNYLYERLRSAPRFRFAIVSVEVSDSFTAEDLSWLAQRTFMDGLVLSQTVWDQLGRPDHFVPFATGYVWRPYEGERYRDASQFL